MNSVNFLIKMEEMVQEMVSFAYAISKTIVLKTW